MKKIYFISGFIVLAGLFLCPMPVQLYKLFIIWTGFILLSFASNMLVIFRSGIRIGATLHLSLACLLVIINKVATNNNLGMSQFCSMTINFIGYILNPFGVIFAIFWPLQRETINNQTQIIFSPLRQSILFLISVLTYIGVGILLVYLINLIFYKIRKNRNKNNLL